MEIDSYLCGIEDDFLDFYDPAMEYADSLDSPYSTNESDQESINLEPVRNRNPKRPAKRIQQRTAANQRERRRMKSINDAFDILRQSIPTSINADRRLSKVDTLKLAIRYIGYLSDMVETSSDYSTETQFTKTNRPQEKVIVRCHFDDLRDPGDLSVEYVGHSLSWSHQDNASRTIDNKLYAKIWTPENPSEADILNLTTYSGELGGLS